MRSQTDALRESRVTTLTGAPRALAKWLRQDIWSNSNYVFLWWGRLISGLGDEIYLFVLPWLLYELSGSAVAMTRMRAIEYLPQVLFGLFVGVLIDRLNRQQLAKSSLVLQTLLVAGLAAIGNIGPLRLWLFYLVGFFLAVAGLVSNSTLLAMLPTIVRKEELTAANAGMGVVDNLIRLGGPSLAGLLVAWIGSVNSLWFDAASFFALILAVALMRVAPQPNIGMRNVRQVLTDIKEGLRFLYGLRPLFWATVWITVDNIGSILLVSILLFHLRDVFNLSSQRAGLILAIGASGMLFTNILAPVIGRKFRRGSIMLVANALSGLGALAIAAASNGWYLAAGYALASGARTLMGLNYAVFRQTMTPTELLGRTGTAVLVLARLMVPPAAALAGLLAETWSSKAVLATSGIISILVSGVVAATPLRFALDLTRRTGEH